MKKVLLMAAAVATLFASCSKDATEDVVTINGDAAFVASMTFDQDATRHHINNEGKYEWEAGDMVGVTTAATDVTEAQYVPFITKAGGEQAIFEAVGNDLAYLGEGPYFMAYPYGETLTVEATEKATIISGLTVPDTQRYRAGSFSTMTAPAYAIVDEFALEGQEVDFNAAAAMMQFFVKGVGSVESFNLHVDGVELSGDFDIVIEAEDAENEDAEVEATAETPAEYSDVLLSFGKAPLQLNPYNAVPVVFVVKSGISLAGKTIELTANFGEQQTETVKVEIPENATNMNDIPANKLVNFTKPKVFGFEGKFVIDNKDAKLGLEGNDVAALDFLAYAYFAQEDTQNNAADWAVVFNKLGANADTLQAYILAEQIDLAAFDAEAAYNKIGEYATRETSVKDIVDVYQHVLTWYIKNDNSIESLYWGEKGIGYYGANEKATVINGLSVKGNGVTAAANLDNLKFTNSVVEAPVAEKSGTYVGFVAPAASTAKVDVVLGEGNVLIASAENTIIGGIFGNIYADNTAKVEVEALPTMNIASAGFAPATVGQLYGYAGANKNFVISLADNKVTSLEEMPAVAIANGPGYVVDFQDAPADATYANIATKKDGTSVVINGVSYWNGNATESSVGGDAYFTAEEFAAALADGTKTLNIELTHGIDMQCSEDQKLTVNPYVHAANVIDGAGFEVKNIIADKGLFGYNATITDLTISNVEINIDGIYIYAAGLARAGKATDVVVDNMVINIAKTATLSTQSGLAINSIGGVFSVANAGDINNVEVAALAVNYAGEEALEARAGVIAGTLNVAPNSTINLGITKLSGTRNKYVFGNIGESQPKTNNPKTALKWYTTEKNYAQDVTPYGTIVVANADFASNGVINAYLNDNAQSKNFGRLAAGIVFSFENNGAPKAFGKDSSVEYKYNFFSNTKINNDADANGKFVWGFNPTAE